MGHEELPAEAWVIAGPPGAGKSTVAQILLARLSPIPALLDKDTLYSHFVSATLSAAGHPLGEREGPWYDEHVKLHEYNGLTATAAEIRGHGCPVVLSAPFTQQIRHQDRWNSFTDQLGGGPVTLVWIRSDAATLKTRLTHRGLARDGEKLRRFAEFVDNIGPDAAPTVPHVVVDNRLNCTASLPQQIDRIINPKRRVNGPRSESANAESSVAAD